MVGFESIVGPNMVGTSNTNPSGFVVYSQIREKLTANRTYYVRSDGNNSNSGLSNSASGAFLTWAAAVSAMLAIDFNGFTVTVTNGDGATYTNGISITSAWAGGGTIVFDINGGTLNVASNCLSLSGFSMPGQVTIQNGTLLGGNAISLNAIGAVQLGTGIIFGACTGQHMFAQVAGATIAATGVAYTISGGAVNHMNSVDGAIIRVPLVTGTVSTSVTFSSTFAFANEGGIIQAGLGTYVLGAFTVTGQRYNVTNNAIINTSVAGVSGGTTYFPGTANGSGTNSGTTPFGLYV